MEATTILDKPVNMYTVDDFNEFSTLNIKDLNNEIVDQANYQLRLIQND